jgi:predicted dehydrogenase
LVFCKSETVADAILPTSQKYTCPKNKQNVYSAKHKPERKIMKHNITKFSRRRFLQTTTAAATGIAVGAFAAPAVLAERNPNSKLNIAVIGVGGRGGGNISELVRDTNNSEKLLAFCDVDTNTLNKQSDHHKVEHRYKDFRKLLDEKAKELDAVLVATPDHLHGIITCTAMKLGLHCYCEKPLGKTVWETREMARFAKEKKLCTQTGTQVRSWKDAHYYRSIELLRAGAIGDITDITDAHAWTFGTYVPPKDPEGTNPVPPHVDYDLWLGPIPFIPFNNAWLTIHKHGFWHSGNGWITGMGPHTIDLIWTALNLTPPTLIEIDGPKAHPLYSRDSLHVTWHHKHANGKPLRVHWYDGKRLPEGIANGLFDKREQGILFLGKEGALQLHYHYHHLLPKEKFADYKTPEQTYKPSIGHQRQWIEAIKENKPELCECRFEYAAPYSEMLTLAGTMHRTDTNKATWDYENMKTDSESTNALIKPVFREGWTFPTL